MSENPQLEKLLETDAARCPDVYEDNTRLQLLINDLYDALKAVKQYGELANVSAEVFPYHHTGGKKPASKDVWQFPRHLLVEIDAALAKAEGRTP